MTVSIDTARATQIVAMLHSRASLADDLAATLSRIGGTFGVSAWTGPAASMAGRLSGEFALSAGAMQEAVVVADAADVWSSGAWLAGVPFGGLALQLGLEDQVNGVLGQLAAWGKQVIEPADPSDPGVAGAPHFVVGPPTRPHITWDEDFVYDSEDAGWRDYLSAAEWRSKLRGGQLLRGDLDDATQMYSHYWGNTGDPIVFDYEEAFREDTGVQASVATEIARAQHAAESLAADGLSDFSMTGDASGSSAYPTTENWQKAIGGHQLWSSADVRIDGTTIEMDITVHAEDYYNFNRSQADLATGASDDENGRFTEIGWARPFPSSGTLTRTIVWEIGSIDAAEVTDAGEPSRNPGREDDELERQDGDADRISVPDNDRSTGGPRAGG